MTTLTGTIKNFDGALFTGHMRLTLSNPAYDPVNNYVILPQPVTFVVTSGAPIAASIVGNDVLLPENTYYWVQYINASGAIVMENPMYISGSTYDLGSAKPTTVTTGNIAYVDVATQGDLRELVTNVKDSLYGAIGNGIANDTAALQTANDAASAAGGTLYFPTGTYNITSDLYITCNVIAGPGATIRAVGTSFTNGAVIIQANKTPGTTAILSFKHIDLPKVINSEYAGGAWGSYKKGIICNNLNVCKINVPYSYGFSVGLDVISYGGVAGTAYSVFNLGYIMDCDYPLKLQPSNATGYVNENTFIAGKLGLNSGSAAGAATLALLPFAGGNNGPNSNKFYSPCVEGDSAGAYAPVYHIIVGGSYNEFYGVRWEIGGGTGRIRFNGADPNYAIFNLFIGSYASSTPVISYEGTWAWAYGNRFIGWGSSIDKISTTGQFFQNPNGGTDPIFRFFNSSKDVLIAVLGDTDWVTEIDSSGLINTKGIMTTSNIYPIANDTHYLGKNSISTPLAWKGLVVKDTTNGNYYRVEVISGVLTATQIT